MRTALALTHVAFEGLGSLAPALAQAGFEVTLVDACTARWADLDPLAPDLLVVLGGPIGVYETAAYPFLDDELALLRARLAAGQPTLGICLGAQLIAAALGARVYPGDAGKEIGWAPLRAGTDVASPPALRELLAPGLRVLHWHGDTFDLPAGAQHLAASAAYRCQAFGVGGYALGLQFHAEVLEPDLERWYVGHACELAAAGIDVPRLRQDARLHAPALRDAAERFWRRWLAETFQAA